MSSRHTFLGILVLGALGFLFSNQTAFATIRQPSGSYQFGPIEVWTDGTTGDIFQPLSDAMPSANLVNARIFLEITEATGGTNLRIRPALRYSADGVSWDTPVAINNSYVQGNATQPGTTWVDLSTVNSVTPKAYMQFGVQLHNNGAGVYEIAHATLLVEPKGK